MWVDYKGVMALVGVGHNVSYKIINQLNGELAAKGYLVNPNHKVPIKFLCERYGIDIEDAREIPLRTLWNRHRRCTGDPRRSKNFSLISALPINKKENCYVQKEISY